LINLIYQRFYHKGGTFTAYEAGQLMRDLHHHKGGLLGGLAPPNPCGVWGVSPADANRIS